MPESRPLLSIVVPTKNRARYATYMIESVLGLEGDDFELVISDNSDDPALASWVAERAPDPRLRYDRVEGTLSMTGNHNAALERASGEYVCLIGDDDTVLPSLLAACRWAFREDLDAVTPNAAARYAWPDMVHRYFGTRQAGMLLVDPWPGTIREGTPRDEARACMRRAGQGTGCMPKVYHGLVRRRCLEEIRRETGAYCHSVSPDVYMAVALCSKVRRQVCAEVPLTLSGSSGGSNAGRAAMRKHKGALWSDPHMRAYKDEPWPTGIPEFFAVETVWAQAALTAAAKTRDAELSGLFDFPLLYSQCLLLHPEYAGLVGRAARNLVGKAGARWSSLSALTIARSFHLLADRGAYAAKRLLRPTPAGYAHALGVYDNVRDARTALIEAAPVRDFPSAFEHQDSPIRGS